MAVSSAPTSHQTADSRSSSSMLNSMPDLSFSVSRTNGAKSLQYPVSSSGPVHHLGSIPSFHAPLSSTVMPVGSDFIAEANGAGTLRSSSHPASTTTVASGIGPSPGITKQVSGTIGRGHLSNLVPPSEFVHAGGSGTAQHGARYGPFSALVPNGSMPPPGGPSLAGMAAPTSTVGHSTGHRPGNGSEASLGLGHGTVFPPSGYRQAQGSDAPLGPGHGLQASSTVVPTSSTVVPPSGYRQVQGSDAPLGPGHRIPTSSTMVPHGGYGLGASSELISGMGPGPSLSVVVPPASHHRPGTSSAASSVVGSHRARSGYSRILRELLQLFPDLSE